MGNHSSKDKKKNIQRRYSCPPSELVNKSSIEKLSSESLQHSRSCSELGSSASSLNKKKNGSVESVKNGSNQSLSETPVKNADQGSILASNSSVLAALAKERSSSQRSVHNSSSTINDKYNIDDILQKIFDLRKNPKHAKSSSRSVGLKNGEIIKLCVHAREILLSQPVLIELNPKPSLVIAGDVHGQYSDLLRIFDRMGHPPQTNYLFMGDYVDRGKKSLETILLLLAYKIKYPENFFLLRGNHECASINRVYGFYDECKRRTNLKVWKTFTDLFNCLPVAAVVAGKIFCVHGGLSPSLHTMEDILKIKRPTDVPEFDLLNDLLWSDPSETAQDWEDNERGVSYCFGKSVVQEFLARNDFDLVCRAHMVVEDGYEFFGNRILVTVFSAPNYCGEFDNNGAVMLVNEDLLCSFEIIQALDANGEPINTLSYSNDYVKETCPSADEIPPVDDNANADEGKDENGSNDALKEDADESNPVLSNSYEQTKESTEVSDTNVEENKDTIDNKDEELKKEDNDEEPKSALQQLQKKIKNELAQKDSKEEEEEKENKTEEKIKEQESKDSEEEDNQNALKKIQDTKDGSKEESETNDDNQKTKEKVDEVKENIKEGVEENINESIENKEAL